jgi:hypothetical protein
MLLYIIKLAHTGFPMNILYAVLVRQFVICIHLFMRADNEIPHDVRSSIILNDKFRDHLTKFL